ncbi:glycoside hydrolase family 3 C-terminal domain-containing protein [Paenibacillus agri]|uniref:Glycoside hydrolase family 3 C-terminal domain-containing protein n=1 Tax=Paenibacillus agri TaxID=2744309 RepID=A0A850EI50_9BACL|nr:glycoside hydrolase family 3 C-terminal domain-containing protein [Paenibacillus agri]NUU60765.1 glycoside hydrolase family 3 C-terminal domain-containing protein [Paenibacillus agri]
MRKNCNRLLKIVFCFILLASIITPGTSSPALAKVLPGLADVSREVAAEGIVLLQNPGYKPAGAQVNENEQVLPIKKSENVSVFGRIQAHYYKSGTGSGGAVRVEYVNGILEGLRNNPSLKLNEDLAKIYAEWIKTHPFNNGGGGWAAEPWSQAEMPLTDPIVDAAKAKSDAAVVIIGRTAGEDKDNTDVKGAYRLTDLEVDMLNKVYAKFDRVAIVLNVANVIDMSWAKNYPKAAIVYAWQGGMEGGSAVADVLTGDVTPSGKLSDTIAATLADYRSTANFGSRTENAYAEDIYVGYRYFETFAPEKVLYPFGFGLSYTNFKITTNNVNVSDDEVAVNVTVQNTGKTEGKEVVQVYYGAPQGKLGKPTKELAAFAKTRLLQPGESQSITITYDTKDMASYDDSGITGHDSSYVLEAGDYNIFVGNSVRDSVKQKTYTLPQLKVVEVLQEALAPTKNFDRIKPGAPKGDGTFSEVTEKVPTRSNNLDERIKQNLPAAIPQTGDKGYTLLDVYNQKVTIDQFIAQFSNNDLGAIILGEGMSSPKVTAGTAAAFGGVTQNLLKFGLPIDSAADGPSGIRMETNAERATSIPNGTMLACTWNTELNERLFDLLGKEMLINNIDTLLGPGINIHRSPLNGRNFEYFSEDPLLTGIMAAAQTKGLQKNGTAPTLKHFVANNQETDRHLVNALVSERALREIYLKGYEMAIKSGKARSVMTSYGPVNGTWAASNYDLNTTILRGEWGFDGIVMTDWWAKLSEDQGFYATSNRYDETNGKSMVRAQNDLYMVIPNNNAETHRNRNNSTFNTMASLTNGSLTVGELQRSAKNIVNFLIQSPAFARTAKVDYVVNYTPGKDWFRVSTAKAGDPQLSGITVGGKKIKIFNPLKLDYKAFGETDETSTYPEVKATGMAGVDVTVRQADKDRPAAVITATAGGEKRTYKVIFSSEEGLEPIFENPTYAYLKSISVGGKPLEGFSQTRFSYDVGLTNGAVLPAVTFETNTGITAKATVDNVNKRVTIKAVSTDQANSYVIQFGTTPQSDEFDSTTLNSFWTINKETATNVENKNNWSLSTVPGFLRIIAERGDFWSDHADLRNYFQQEAFGNWEATVKINMSKAPNQNYNGVGITASQDNNNYIWVKYEFSTGKIIGMVKETGGTAPVTIGQLSASQVTNVFGDKKELYLRLKKIGNSYSGYVSADGVEYISLGSTTANYANPKFGLLASNGSQVLTEPFIADFDYVRIKSDVALAVKKIGKNTKLKVAETEFSSITPVITPVTCNDVDGGLCYTNTNKGEAISYKVNVEKAGTYKVTSRLRSSQSDVAQMSFGVYDGDKHLGTFDLTTTKGEWKTFRIPDVQLSAGEHNLRIVFESAGIDINWLTFQLKQDNVDTSALDAAIKAAQNIDMNAYTSYKKLKFNAVLEEVKGVLLEPINDEVVADAIAVLNAAIADLNTSSMPVNLAPKDTQSVENGTRVYAYNAPWIYAGNTQFRFEAGTDAMSYVNSNDLVYFGQIDLTNLAEIRVQYAREGASAPSFKFYTEADNTGKPVKRSTTQGRAYADAYSGGGSFEYGNEFASITLAQKAGAAWTGYGMASTKQTLGNANIDHYVADDTFLDRSKATGKQNVYMRFNGLNANLQYIELIYAEPIEVTFDLNYPEAPAAAKVKALKGETFGTLPQAPVREDFLFEGWYDNKAGEGSALTSQTVLNASTVFYAKWKEDLQAKEIVSIAQPQLLSVPFGTAAEELNLPPEVEATLGNHKTVNLTVQWDTKDYNGGKAGNYTLAGTFELPESVLNSANKTVAITVVVLPEGTHPIKITEVEKLESRSVDFGTTFDKLDLPSSASVTLDTYGTKALAVEWSPAGYNGNAEGSYTLSGTLVLEEGMINPSDLKASIIVNVLPEVVKVAKITAVQELEGKSIPFGTEFAGLKLPSSVTATLDTGETKDITVKWSSEGYNGHQEGSYTLSGTLVPAEGIINPDDLKASITVHVLPEVIKLAEIKTVQALAGKSVAYGTGFNSLELPGAVSVTLNNGDIKIVSVQWNQEGYNGNAEGTYTLTGNLILPEGVVNPQSLKAEISVVVRPNSGGSSGGDGGSSGGGQQPGGSGPSTPVTPSVPGEIVKPGEQQPQSPATGEGIKTPEQIKQELSLKFKDAVLIPSWAESAVAALAEKKIIGGRTDGSFDPSGQVNRAEFLAMVVKSFDFSLGDQQKSFTDVLSGAWYKTFVDIGTSNNLINGIGNGLFAPNKSISRQDLCVIAFNALKKLNVELPQVTEHDFPDDASIAGYAKEAVYAFKALGIVNGGTGGKMDPTAPATRAEAAVIIKNVLDYYTGLTSTTVQ